MFGRRRDGATVTPRGELIGRRRFLRRSLLAAAAVAALGLEGARQAHAFGVTRHKRTIRGLRAPLRLSLLTDLHMGPYMRAEQLAQWVEASNALDPDLVVLGGDLVDRWYSGDLSEFVELLPRLQQRSGVLAVLGNHDHVCYPDLAPLLEALDKAGVRLLTNDGFWLREDVYIAGIDDWKRGAPDVAKAFAAAAEADRAGARILVSHNPDVIPDLGSYLNRPPDLVLSGHTHGGQICLPLIGPVVTSSDYGRRFAQGWVEEATQAFISRGLGVSLLPMRMLCPPELALLELEPG